MKSINAAILMSSLLGGCAATVPVQLSMARQAYLDASRGPAATAVPAELHKAHEALKAAESAFIDDPTGFHTLDLAYVAQRKAELSQALATQSLDRDRTDAAKAQYQSSQDAIMLSTRTKLGESEADLAASQTAMARTSADLAASQRSGAETAEQLVASQDARALAESRAAAANAALAKLAAVKEEARGLVLTLSGSVLFRSGEATLLGEAEQRLDQVAAALLETKDRSLIVEGHTDSQGTNAYNVDLSQRRADAVRSYLVGRGYDASSVRAVGIGEDRPIASNQSAEGRANNRRVEIVIEPAKSAAR